MITYTDEDKKSTTDVGLNSPTIIVEKILKVVTGDVKLIKYSKGRLLSKGAFAKYYEFTCCDTKKVYTAKVIAKSSLKSSAKQRLITQIKIHSPLHHSKIVKFEHCFEDKENIYILLEMCQNQSLNELLKRRKKLSEIEVQCYIIQIIEALKYIHSKRIIHRDLKLGNLFLTDQMELKLGGFDVATKLDFEGERKRTVCGSPNFIAPEILYGKSGHSYEVDIWSIGVICYTLIIGKLPFGNQVKTAYKNIKMNSLSFPNTGVISDAAKALITELLNIDPLKRPTLDKILAHDFFNQGTIIPRLLPTSTLACPPSITYLKQFMPESCSIEIDKRSESITKIPPTTDDNPNNNLNNLYNKLMTDRNRSQDINQRNGMLRSDTQALTIRSSITNYMSTKRRVNSLCNNCRDSRNQLCSKKDMRGKTIDLD